MEWSDAATWRSKVCPCAQCDNVMTQEVALDVQTMSNPRLLSCSETMHELACLLDAQTLPLFVSRTNVYSREGHALRGLHFGVQLQRGKGTSVQDIRHSDLLCLIHVLAGYRKVRRMYTAVQLNCLESGQSVPPHLDELNVGVSIVIAFGQFKGGELQVMVGDSWETVACDRHWKDLDPQSVHRVLPVTEGKRYSIVLYNPRDVTTRITEQDMLRLRTHGFPAEASTCFETEVQQRVQQVWIGSSQVNSCESSAPVEQVIHQAFPVQTVEGTQLLPSAETQPFPAGTERQLHNLVQRCHERMGHPHPAHFVRILRAAQASTKVLAIASNLQCSICAQTNTPVPHHKSASLPCLGRRRRRTDERLGTDGTHHEVTPTDAPWQNGRTKRHGGTVKLMLTRARMSQPPKDKEELEELLCATVHAKNAFSLVGGYSPHQRVFGTQLQLPGGNLGDEWRE
eukprot:6491835-Amphidinium_carterae.1